MSLKVAVVGAGSMAREHIRAFADVPGVSIVGIHSRTRDKAETLARELSVPTVCGSVSELHEKTAADLVVVAVPELAGRKVAEACFAHSWGVLLEKPAGYDLADAEAIAAAARAKKRRVWVGLNRRFLSSTQMALADLATNNGPRYIHVQDQQNLADAAAIGHPAVVVENWMYANSIHVIDYLSVFGRGSVKSVDVIRPWAGEASNVVLAKIDFHGGDVGLYEGIWQGPGPWAVTVSTPAKRWEFRPLENAVFQVRGERRLQPTEPHPWDKQFKSGFRRQAEEVVRALGGQPSQAPTLEQSLDTMRLIAAIFRKK